MMHSIYSLAVGPLFLISLAIFLSSIFYKVISIIITVKRNEQSILKYISIKHSILSVLHWILPYASTNWRKNPILTIVTFSFHICCIVTPIFLLSHVVLLDEYINFKLWYIPTTVSDLMTLIVLICLVYFFFRRVSCQEIKFVTTVYDYMILLLIAIPFSTGFIAYHQWINYDIFIIIHIISAEILLILIPYTRLSHMFLFFLSRAYIGSEFGSVRNSKDW